MVSRRVEIFLEFLIFGVVVGLIEDLIAVYFITGEPITPQVVWIALMVAVPFAFLGEVIVDRKHLFPVKSRQGLKKLLAVNGVGTTLGKRDRRRSRKAGWG